MNNKIRFYSEDPNQQLQYNQQFSNQSNPFDPYNNQQQQGVYQLGNFGHAAINNQTDLQNLNQKELVATTDSVGRAGFIVKEYATMTFQLAITFLFILASYYFENVRNIIIIINPGSIQYTPLMIFCLIIAFVIEIAIFCCKNVSRRIIINYVNLYRYVQITYYSSFLLCVTVHLWLLLVLFVFIYYQTEMNYQFSNFYSLISYHCSSNDNQQLLYYQHFMPGILKLIIQHKVNSVLLQAQLYQRCATLVYLFEIFGFLIYDTQLIVGEHSYYLSVDDYTIAALLLYVDIVILFLKILEILLYIFGKR
ncbi:unnamed protein product [Paramecium sonneborni]|uniref:Transmembrane protein n=1 Tax=Paramecium sonneborni TaxID=65129 RepID=A0A8S1RFL3_9CILI|nr:unnamed protein product [Paramecium sonneborni]